MNLEQALAPDMWNMQADGAIPADRPFDLARVTDATYLRAGQTLGK